MNGGIDSDLIIDHIDRNPRNNNIWNLRALNSSQNNYNKTPSEYENYKRANGLPRNIYKKSKSMPPDSFGRDYLTAQIRILLLTSVLVSLVMNLPTLLLWLETKKG